MIGPKNIWSKFDELVTLMLFTPFRWWTNVNVVKKLFLKFLTCLWHFNRQVESYYAKPYSRMWCWWAIIVQRWNFMLFGVSNSLPIFQTYYRTNLSNIRNLHRCKQFSGVPMIEVTEIDAFTDIGTKKPKITTAQSVDIRA